MRTLKADNVTAVGVLRHSTFYIGIPQIALRFQRFLPVCCLLHSHITIASAVDTFIEPLNPHIERVGHNGSVPELFLIHYDTHCQQ